MNYNMIQRILCAVIVIASSFIFGVTAFGQVADPDFTLYKVRKGDSSTSIALQKHVPLQLLRQLNDLEVRPGKNKKNFYVLFVDQELKIPTKKLIREWRTEQRELLAANKASGRLRVVENNPTVPGKYDPPASSNGVPRPQGTKTEPVVPIAKSETKIQKPGQRNQPSSLGRDAKQRLATFNNPQNLLATMTRMDADLTAAKQKSVQLENERNAALTKASAQEALVSDLQKTVEFQKRATRDSVASVLFLRNAIDSIVAVIALAFLGVLGFFLVQKSRQFKTLEADASQLRLDKDADQRKIKELEGAWSELEVKSKALNVTLEKTQAFVKRLSEQKTSLEQNVKNLQQEKLAIEQDKQQVLAQNQQLQLDKQYLVAELQAARTATSKLPDQLVVTVPKHTTPMPATPKTTSNGVPVATVQPVQ